MGKLEENNNIKNAQIDENLNEEEYSQWIQKQFLKEAEEIEKELGDIPDSEDWEPTEEKFQALLKRAREQELLDNPDNFLARDNDDGIKKQTTKELKEKIIQAEEMPARTKNKYRKKKVIKWTAAAAATFIGIFGFTMTSEASRAYIMEEVNRMFGNDVNTEIDNDDDNVFHSDRTEQYAYEDIENTLYLSMPEFFYVPSDMNYQGYAVDKEAKTAYIQYSWEEWTVYFMVFSNIESATGLSQNDIGKELEEISSDLTQNLNITLWEIQEEGDEKPTYSLKWEYKNSYYEFWGKIPKEEMQNIAKKLVY